MAVPFTFKIPLTQTDDSSNTTYQRPPDYELQKVLRLLYKEDYAQFLIYYTNNPQNG